MTTPGLDGDNETTSFQSVEDPRKYLCASNDNILKLCDEDDFDDTDAFNCAASFNVTEELYLNDSVSFESCASPGHFIQNDNGTFVVEVPDGSVDPAVPSFDIISPEDIPGEKSIMNESLETVPWLM